MNSTRVPSERKKQLSDNKEQTDDRTCKCCAKKFSNTSNKRRHVKQMTRKKLQLKITKYIRKTIDTRGVDHVDEYLRQAGASLEVRCGICDAFFSDWAKCKRHINEVHAGNKPYVCLKEGCHKEFSRKSNMYRHFHTHNKNSPAVDKNTYASNREIIINQETNESSIQ